jgi:hypothetical protein
MRTKLTRRAVLPAVGAIGGGLLAGLVALLPEVQLSASAAAPTGHRVRVRYLLGGELAAAVARSQADPKARATLNFLSSGSFAARSESAMAIEVTDENGRPYGALLAMDFSDPAHGREARLMHRTAGDASLLGATTWSAADPTLVDVFVASGEGIVRSSSVRLHPDGSARIEWASGEATDVPARPQLAPRPTGSGRAGVAAPVQDWVEFCEWVCNISCGVVCGLEWLVICAACTGGTFGACAIICVVVAVVTCLFSCTNWCGVSCRLVWI